MPSGLAPHGRVVDEDVDAAEAPLPGRRGPALLLGTAIGAERSAWRERVFDPPDLLGAALFRQ